ncbi:MAG: ABC transporter ATP-binding protein [Planctomycetes bacterium]|nr:ABC transporter ATP-binding protein [Planctomycetota bacterium]
MESVRLADLDFTRPRGGFRLGPLRLELAAGSRTALIGPSGCGKSTLLRLIAGFELPTGGTIAIGPQVVSEPQRLLVSPDRRGIGFVFQDGALWPHLDAVDHLRFVARDLSRAAAVELLAQVGLGDKARRRPAQLSGGEAQRLALARALAREPRILLLDEPLASVDVHLRDELALLVRRIAIERALTLVVVTHDRDEALAMADDVVVLRDGRIVEQGAAESLVQEPRTAFSAAFLAHAACIPLESGPVATGRSPFGDHELPSGATTRDHVLALLPGDVTLSTNGVDASCKVEVRQVRTDSFGHRYALVELSGQTLFVPCDRHTVAGARVGLRLARPARILPAARDEGTPR